MPEFRLHCFALSGNSYKAALFLQLAQLDWEAVFVDYLGDETRREEWRQSVNEQGECPVLEHAGAKISQSALILDYLAELTSHFSWNDTDEKREIWRWMLFDNHKFTSYYATLRFMYGLQKSGETPVTQFLRDRATAAYRIVEHHLGNTPFLVGPRPTIADLSLAGYVYMPEETGMSQDEFPNIAAWKERIKRLPGWQHPYDLMPGPTTI